MKSVRFNLIKSTFDYYATGSICDDVHYYMQLCYIVDKKYIFSEREIFSDNVCPDILN